MEHESRRAGVLNLFAAFDTRIGQVYGQCYGRTRLRIVDFASTADLAAKLAQCIAEGNEVAHPFKWTTKSVMKVLAAVIPAAA